MDIPKVSSVVPFFCWTCVFQDPIRFAPKKELQWRLQVRWDWGVGAWGLCVVLGLNRLTTELVGLGFRV